MVDRADSREIAKRAKELYEDRWRAELERDPLPEFAAMEPESATYFARRGGRVWRLCGRPGIFVGAASVVLGAIHFASDPVTSLFRSHQRYSADPVAILRSHEWCKTISAIRDNDWNTA